MVKIDADYLCHELKPTTQDPKLPIMQLDGIFCYVSLLSPMHALE